MVYICGLHTESVTGADPTEGLAGQLSATPSFPAISWIRVQVMPGCRFLSLCLRFVIRAVAICREDLTPWCFASSHWFVHFDLQKTQKEPETQIAFTIHGSGSKAQAQARYSRWIPGDNACRKPAGLLPWLSMSAAAISFRRSDTSAIPGLS